MRAARDCRNERLCKPRGGARLPRDVGGSDPDSQGGATRRKQKGEEKGILKSKTWKGKMLDPRRETQRSSWGRWACRVKGKVGDRPWDDVCWEQGIPGWGQIWVVGVQAPMWVGIFLCEGPEALLWKGRLASQGQQGVALELRHKNPGSGGMCSGDMSGPGATPS